jgi:Bacterial PH domain
VTELQWRVDRRLTILKAAGAAVFVVAAVLLARDAAGLALGLLAACVLGGFALRDVLAPVRLAADPNGVTVVTGFNGRRHIPWAEVERVRVDSQRRLGRRLEFLEIDTGETLHLFSSAELGADCDEVAAALATLRTGR